MRPLRAPAARASKPHLAGEDLPPEPPVSDEREPRMLERRRLVVLEEKMADPGERIALNEGGREQPPDAHQEGRDDEHSRDTRTGEVQPTRGAVRMLAQIERIEFAKGGKGSLAAHADPSGQMGHAYRSRAQRCRTIRAGCGRGSLTDARLRRPPVNWCR